MWHRWAGEPQAPLDFGREGSTLGSRIFLASTPMHVFREMWVHNCVLALGFNNTAPTTSDEKYVRMDTKLRDPPIQGMLTKLENEHEKFKT